MGKFNELLKATVSEQADSTSELILSGGTVVNLIAKPLRPADFVPLKRNHPDFVSNPTPEGMVELIIAKARDAADDTPAFDVRDRAFLMRMDTVVIGRIFSDLFGGQMTKAADDEIKEKVGN